MALERILPYAKNLLTRTINSGDTVIDATCGNGLDTEFLAKLVGDKGSVYAFDVQTDAIEATRTRLQGKNINNVKLIHDGHERVLQYVSSDVSSAIFNLGYLPGSDKSITTKGDTTWLAIVNILSILKKGGLIILVVYHGHAEGKLERSFIEEKISTLNTSETEVLRYQFLNKKDAPYIIAIEKK